MKVSEIVSVGATLLIAAVAAPFIVIPRVLFFLAVRPWWVERWKYERRGHVIKYLIRKGKSNARYT